ncbi:MAG: hypothetical protein E7660_05430 [Ruminococcaceae bacterium]|nr:hypothetical protein [Oscillospiraceae bacterium]
MAEKIPGEILSPNLCDGVLTWCRSDTFTLHLTLELYAMGEKYDLPEGSEVEVSFRDRSDFEVKVFSAVVNNCNCITLEFDKETSSAFDKGRYLWDVCITDTEGNRKTVANDNVAVVI